jgi:FtsP/CotA-like multicopper oxidase with cupredoxin domain
VLPIPRVIDAAAFDLDVVESEIAVLPGAKTRMWTYGGDFPGPTIRRPVGERTLASFRNRLPAKAGELTVHLHGAHNTSADDGQPGGLTNNLRASMYCDISNRLTPAESGNDLLIEHGAQRTYTYDFVEGGQPERAAMHWYHDHRLDRTSRNVWRGLAGMWISDDALDASLPLPRGSRDIPLMICDRSFDRRNQLTNPFSDSAHAPNDGIVGNRILVNGAVLPHHRVNACRYRLRILNASQFRNYNLVFEGGVAVTQIGTEAGLMPKPLKRRRILIGAAERVDMIVDFSRAKHSNVVLKSVRRGNSPGGIGSRAYAGPLMQFRVGKPIPDSTSVPAELRPLPDWVESAPRSPAKTWTISIGKGFSPPWLINGRTFDPAYVEHRPRLGTVETWKLVNKTTATHLLHIHHTDWYLLSRNGKPPPPWEDCLKETFLMDPGETLLVAGRFSDYAGKFVIHCHMLDHEDHGLMSQFETVA